MAKGMSTMHLKQPKQPDVVLVPAYWEDAKLELMKRDRIMKKLIPRFGDLQLVGRGEPFVNKFPLKPPKQSGSVC